MTQRPGHAQLRNAASDADAHQHGPGHGIMRLSNEEHEDAEWRDGERREPEDDGAGPFRTTQVTEQQANAGGDDSGGKRDGKAQRREVGAVWADHDDDPHEAQQNGGPAMRACRFPQQKRGEQGGEYRHGEADCRGLSQGQQQV